ncbi:hypothetical protein H6G97_17870 [Nostoc flagelliforme FACHB-838]|uniref:Transposase n=1 Tax=Nostoc flagelliforme FACHB-838 TaxID=2692904 RepID=A0ABR8DPG7_9NOSO|nr:hypothetical protein [Nostoc flagelliforme]MBD2531352.1 hypothetical protein [Nostoc flagelliforme FACHB-838]
MAWRKSDTLSGLRQRTTPKFGRNCDRLCKGYRKSAIAPHLSLLQGAIACMKVIKKRSHPHLS